MYYTSSGFYDVGVRKGAGQKNKTTAGALVRQQPLPVVSEVTVPPCHRALVKSVPLLPARPAVPGLRGTARTAPSRPAHNWRGTRSGARVVAGVGPARARAVLLRGGSGCLLPEPGTETGGPCSRNAAVVCVAWLP